MTKIILYCAHSEYFFAVISIIFLSAIFFIACNSSDLKNVNELHETSSHEARKIVEELHRIECSQLATRSGAQKFSGVYEFRAEAFHQVLANPDRRLLAHYEWLFQRLAQIEFDISPEGKSRHNEMVEDIYRRGCP